MSQKTASKIKNDRKRALMVSSVGSEVHSNLKDIEVPEKIIDKTYEEIKRLLIEFCDKKQSFSIERYYFYQAYQKENEKIKEFQLRLKSLTKECHFEEFLQQALRDKFIMGLKSNEIRKSLLRESEPTLTKCIEIAKRSLYLS